MPKTYKFPERLKELMDEEGLNQSELAKRIKGNQPTVNRWLLGTRKPSVDALISLAGYFRCSIDYLVGLED